MGGNPSKKVSNRTLAQSQLLCYPIQKNLKTVGIGETAETKAKGSS